LEIGNPSTERTIAGIWLTCGDYLTALNELRSSISTLVVEGDCVRFCVGNRSKGEDGKGGNDCESHWGSDWAREEREGGAELAVIKRDG